MDYVSAEPVSIGAGEPYMSRVKTVFWIPLASLLCAPLNVRAHHAYTEYDQGQTIEIEGKLVRVAWQNPHAHLVLQVAGNGGRLLTFDVEGPGLNVMRRMNVPLAIFRAGDKAKIAGWPSKRSATRMFATNLLSNAGQELVVWRYSKPRWSNSSIGYGSGASSAHVKKGVTRPGTVTIFRVWSLQPKGAEAEAARASRVFPLTQAAKKKFASWNPIHDTVAVGCKPKGMPIAMFNPFPMEFIDKGDRILLRMELYDLVRTIHMGASAPAETQPRSLLGYSTGRWDGTTLVINTSRIDWPYLEIFGVPQSSSSRLVERFTLSADGSNLDYTLTATDPEVLTEPVEFKWGWVWRPDEKIMPYNCISDK